jgi:starch phosphorylase
VNPYLRNSDLAKDFSPTEIEGFDSLAELALNMRWSWNHATDEVWRQLDPKLWEITHNPWVVLQTASRDQIKLKLAELTFRKQVDGLVQTAKPSDLCGLFQHGIYVE